MSDTELLKVIFPRFHSVGVLNLISMLLLSHTVLSITNTHTHRFTFPAKDFYSVQITGRHVSDVPLRSTRNDYCITHWGKDGCSGLLQNF